MIMFEDCNTKLCITLIVLSWVLIILIVAFWDYSNGQTQYFFVLFVIPVWMFIRIRLEEGKR
jgi:hypothetical protein